MIVCGIVYTCTNNTNYRESRLLVYVSGLLHTLVAGGINTYNITPADNEGELKIVFPSHHLHVNGNHHAKRKYNENR